MLNFQWISHQKGELWGSYCEFLEENGTCYNAIALYYAENRNCTVYGLSELTGTTLKNPIKFLFIFLQNDAVFL